MMFVYSVMHQQNGAEAIGSQPNQKMLPASGKSPQNFNFLKQCSRFYRSSESEHSQR